MAGKHQRPQIMPPSMTDLKTQESRSRYLEKHARRVNDAFAEVYALFDKQTAEMEKLKAELEGVKRNG